MNQLREDLNRMLRDCPARRPAALRRSLRDDRLYAADLPRAADGEAVSAFLDRVREAGWQAEIRDGWIELDRPLERPPAGWIPGRPGPETECCLSLLERAHPDREGTDPREAEAAAARAVRRLIKAGEAGGAAWEDTCRDLHREWAERLREGKAIPPVDTGFFRIKEE